MERFAHIIRYQHVFTRHDTLDCRHDELVAYVDIQFLQMAFEIGRRHHKQYCVGLPGHIIYVG